MREVASLLTDLKDTQAVIASILKVGNVVQAAEMEGTSIAVNMPMHLRQTMKG